MATYKGVVPGGKYTFNATAGTITFDPDYTGIVLSDIMLITNVKSGIAVTIYDPFDTTKGGSLTGLVLTLAFSTTGMASGDPLQIIVGMVTLPTALPTGAATESTLSTLSGKIPSGLTVTSSKLDVNIGTTGTVGVSSLPSLPAGSNAIGTVTANAGTGNFTVIQGTAASLKTAAEVYQGGVPVSSSAPLAVASAATFNGGVICGSGNDPASLPTGCGSSTGTFGGTAGASIPIVEASANIYGWYFYNPNTVAAYVKIWNTTNPLVNFNSNVTTPLVCVLVIPPVSGANVFGIGITCNAGVRITIATSRNGQTSLPLAIDYNIFYKTA